MALVEIMKPLLGLTEHHCKNSKEPRSQKSQNSTKRKPQISNIRSLQKDQLCYGLGEKIIGTKENRIKHWIKEAMEIRRHAERAVNRDMGGLMLSYTWDTLLKIKNRGGPACWTRHNIIAITSCACNANNIQVAVAPSFPYPIFWSHYRKSILYSHQ